jgi:hypothetical protein
MKTMKVIASTKDFFVERRIALRQIKAELFRKKKPSDPYDQFSKEIEAFTDEVTKNWESAGKKALELWKQEGLIDSEGFVSQKGKSLGLTSKIVCPFGFKPTGLN